MKRTILAALVILISAFATGQAQETYFGKNKVRYKDFDWKYIQTRHFDIHFYEDAYPTAKFAAAVLESAYTEISSELTYHIQKRVPVFVYNSHNDFQQTNIIPNLIPEGVGGFTEAFKNRIVIPFTGSYEDFRHVLHHELTHAVIYNMLFGNSFSSIISRQRLFDLPLWFAEGYAEYSSRHGWDYWADMVVRDATINDYLAPPQYLGGYLAYKQGQAMVKYIADKYGEDKLGEILRKGKVYLTMNRALKEAIGISEEKLWKEFSMEMKRRYWPEIADRKNVDEISRQLTKARKDGSYFNEEPAFSPEGDKIAIFTDRSDYTEIVLISASDGRKEKTLVKAERSGDLESLHSYVSGISWSPDGSKLVFVAKSGGNDALFFFDAYKGDTYRKKELAYYNALSPAWSPDGKKVAFSALKEHKRDIFVYHLDTDEIEQITDDRYDDVDPTWMKESNSLVFSSDRPHPQNPERNAASNLYVAPGAFMPGDFQYGFYNLFSVELNRHEVEPINVGPGQNKSPEVSPDGSKIAFVSNRSGIDNLYIASLNDMRYYAVTDVISGIKSISWSPDAEEIAFSAFSNGAFDIFVLEELVPVGDHGQLAETDYIKGEYALLKKAPSGNALSSHRSKGKDAKKDSSVTADAAAVDTSDAAPDTTLASNEPEGSDTTLAVDEESSATDSTVTVAEAGEVKEEPDTAATTDTTVAVVDSTTAASDTLLAEADSTAADSTKSDLPETKDDEDVISETGVYEGDYVFVSEESEDPLDSVMEDVAGGAYDSSGFGMTEPAEFDSIPGPTEEGEYEVNEYEVRFTPDFVYGAPSYDTRFGFRGQAVFAFSDYLGNHQLFFATDLVNTIDQSFIQAYYFNNRHRTNYGLGIFHTKNFYIDSQDFLFSDRFYGAQVFVNRPFSTFSRLEMNLSQIFIDRDYVERFDPRENRSSKVTTGEISYVTDNVIWGVTGPVNGRRAKLSLEGGVNFFDAADISFYAAELDYRKYWHFKKSFSMAFRISGAASFGETPKLYFLGGTTNWIGNRTLDARVYDVENLYFAEVVTPLRAVDYYELSGDRYALINWEFRFPMIDYFIMRFPLGLALSRIQGSIFTDIGAAWTGDNFKLGSTSNGSRLQDVKTGFGFGMRANLGFVVLRYDLAWSTDFYDVSAHPRSYFSFGADF